MNTSDSIEEMIRDAVANDYETFESIYDDVRRWVASEGATLTRDTLEHHLGRLVKSGVVTSYVLDSQAAEFNRTDFDPQLITKYLFRLQR